MYRILLYFLLLGFTANAYAQTFAFNEQGIAKDKTISGRDDDKFKPKPIHYNALGYLHVMAQNDLIVGGTSVVYKRLGTFLAYDVGIKNFSLPNGTRGDILYENVESSGGSFTGSYQKAVTLMLSTGITFSIWKKMPIYVGGGFTRYRYFVEYLDPQNNMEKRWTRDDKRTGFQLNYTAGFFIPLFSRIVLNMGYNYNPESVFIGIAIRGKDVYHDIDEWK